MTGRYLLAALACVFAAVTGAWADDAAVRYRLTPVLDHGKLSGIAIEVAFKGEADGETTLLLPDAWGGQRELWRAITDIKISGDGVSIKPDANQSVRIIKHAPNAEISVSYRVFQDVPGEPKAADDNPYRPIVQPTYFHLIGETVFALPEWDQTVSASFALGPLPRGWRFASDLEHSKRTGEPLTLGSLSESILVGGDFRVLSRPGLGGNLRVALRGKWPNFTDEGITDQIARIIAAHNAFWGDPDEPFLVTILPLKGDPNRISLGGTGRADAFAFFATDNGDDVTINRILAHEHIHTWVPRRIGRMPERDEPRDYWLSEGFTDFYAYRLLVRDGMWTVENYADALNETLMAYWSSPARNAPNTRIVSDFWNDQFVGKLPYQRGNLLALRWDAQLHAASKGARDFDDVVLAMRARMRTVDAGEMPPYAVDNFATEMRAAGLDPAKDLAQFVEKGETVSLAADTFAPCGTIASLDIPEFTRGFDSQKTAAAGNVVTGVDPDGPAYAAGMRDGMKIIKREAGKPGDSRVELLYRVDDHGTERLIRYKPEGKKRIAFQEFQLAAGFDRAACAKRIGGT